MSELQKIQQKKKEILAVAQQHGILNIRIFGSVARGEDNLESDIDLLVDLEKAGHCLTSEERLYNSRISWVVR